MARGPQEQAKNLYNQTQAVGSQAQGNASQLYNTLFPLYEQEATHPQGFEPGDEAAMETAGEQATGGSTAGAVGQGNLMAARTRNVGGFQTSGDETARNAMRTNSENAVNIKGANARAKLAESSEGLAGMAGLHNTSVNELLQSMGLGDKAINTEVSAGQSGWLQNFMKILQTAGGLAGGAGTLMTGASDAGLIG